MQVNLDVQQNIEVFISQTIPNCVSPLLFELNGESAVFAHYCLGGSGFLVKYLDRYYFVVAGHCLKGNLDKDLRIPLAPDVSQILPFEAVGRPRFAEGEDDTDRGDFALLSIADEFEPAKLSGALEPVHISKTDTREFLREGALLTFRGFPYAAPETKIDPVKHRIHTQALVSCHACKGV